MAIDHVETALALGGLAGHNAFGAGVLQAVLDKGTLLDMVSCTSGQIHWLHRYLVARHAGGRSTKNVLRKQLEADIDAVSPTHLDSVDALWGAVAGKAGVYRPALAEFPMNLLRNLSDAFGKIVTKATADWRSLFAAYRDLAATLPAQTLVPEFSDEFFQSISDCFNREERLGIVFNSYAVQEGVEYVYLNDRAFSLMNVSIGQRNRYRESTCYQRISPDGVREGLWIYEYGEPRGVEAVDGAYFRQIILSELGRARRIFVARPIGSAWFGSFPQSWTELQDLKTKVNFNGSYIGEIDKLALTNWLFRIGALDPKVAHQLGFHTEIDIVEIPYRKRRSFFDYVHESLDVFDHGHENAMALL